MLSVCGIKVYRAGDGVHDQGDSSVTQCNQAERRCRRRENIVQTSHLRNNGTASHWQNDRCKKDTHNISKRVIYNALQFVFHEYCLVWNWLSWKLRNNWEKQCCCSRGKSLSSRILESNFQFTSLCTCPWPQSPWKYIVKDFAFCKIVWYVYVWSRGFYIIDK